MQISRLPKPLVRHEHGMLKDHVVVMEDEDARRVAWRINASFAGYLAGKMAELVSCPEAVSRLEDRLAQDGLMPESRTLFRDMVRTARRRQDRVQAAV